MLVSLYNIIFVLRFFINVFIVIFELDICDIYGVKFFFIVNIYLFNNFVLFLF